MIYKQIFKTYSLPPDSSLVRVRLRSLLASHAVEIIAFADGQTVAAQEQVCE